MKILIAGFKGDDNSAKILLDYIKKVCNEDILYLENDFEISSKQIEEKLLENYDNVLILVKNQILPIFTLKIMLY